MQVPGTFELTLDLNAIQASDLPNVCIVTGELIGPFNNGGLGTSMTGLAELLSAYGAAVTVLYTGTINGDIKKWTEQYKNAGINLEILNDNKFPLIVGPLVNISWTNAWNLYQFLRNKSFDVIHFNDTMGEGLYCLVAKRFGLAFKDTLLSLALHSPTEWILENNRHPADWLGFCCFMTGERISIAATDLLWGPSQYLVEWLQERNYKLPNKVYQQQYVMPTDKLFQPGRSKYEEIAEKKFNKNHFKPKEFVFFGRLEERKGIRLFTSAITMISDILKQNDITVVFLGKHSSVGGMPSNEFLDARTRNWSCNWRIEDNHGQQEAITYLNENDRLAVIASPVDNSPCTVYEVLMHGIPFIAARTGGIPELIHREDHDAHLFNYTVNDLKEILLTIIKNGIYTARPAIAISDNQLRWLNYHVNWRKYLTDTTPKIISNRWAICIDHAGDELDLKTTLTPISRLFADDISTIFILCRNSSQTGVIDLNSHIIIDEFNDKTCVEIFDNIKNTDSTLLFCIRSGVEINAESIEGIESALAGEIDAIIPSAKINENNTIMPVLAGSAAFSCLECEYDPGGIFVALNGNFMEKIVYRLDRDRLYMGLLEELYAVNAVIWPYPEAILTLPKSSDAIVPNGIMEKRLRAYASAPYLDIYQLLSIGKRLYRANNPASISNKSRDLNYIKSYLRSNPRIRTIIINIMRIIFGNRVVKKMLNTLLFLSHI